MTKKKTKGSPRKRHEVDVVNLVDYFRALLNLQSVVVEVERDNDLEEAGVLAEVRSMFPYRSATVSFSPELLDLPHERFDHVVMHEVLHVLFGSYGLLSTYDGDKTDTHSVMVESITDHLAMVLSSLHETISFLGDMNDE